MAAAVARDHIQGTLEGMLRWTSRALVLTVAAVAVVALSAGVLGDADRPGLAVPGSATTTPPQPDGPWGTLAGSPNGAALGVLYTPSGIMAPITAAPGDGSYEVQTPCDARLVLSSGYPLTGAHIVLDPGHGGEEPGAVGPNGLQEKDLNLSVALRTAEILREAGATVVLTRDTDMRMTLATRAGIAMGLRPVAFLSIHHNASPEGPSAIPGTEVYFQVSSTESRRLGGLVVEELRAALTPYGVAWQSNTDNGAKARVQAASPTEDYYGVLRRTAGVTAVLSEAGFLSNPPEAELFAREDVQQAEAEALARALTRFVTDEVPADRAFSPSPPTTGPRGGAGGSADGCVDPVL